MSIYVEHIINRNIHPHNFIGGSEEDTESFSMGVIKDWKGRLQMLLARRYRGVVFNIQYESAKSEVRSRETKERRI